MPSAKSNYLPKSPPPNTVTLALGFQHTNLGEGGHKHLVHSCWENYQELLGDLISGSPQSARRRAGELPTMLPSWDVGTSPMPLLSPLLTHYTAIVCELVRQSPIQLWW